MVSFRQLHSHLKLLSNNNLQGTRTESGFKRAFATLFGQDIETFTGTMFLNVDQLEKQLDKEEFQEIGSMAAFKIPEFRDTLIQHMESVKKSIDERALHKREYDIRVNERQIQTTEGKVDTGKAVDASLVNTESIGTESKEQDTSSRSGNDAHADDADIRPIYDEEPMAEVQTTAEINVFATGQQHTEQPEFNNEGEVDQNVEQCHDTCPLPANVRRSYALSWKPCQGDSLNLPDHRIHKDGDGDALFQLKSDSLPHAHAQTTKTYYKHQDSRIMKAQELKTKTSAQTLIYKIFLQRYQVYQGRLLASFQDDAKYEHVGQDTRSQGGKDNQDGRIKI
ncbi:hypothetical protein Tco_0266946 [Tanacetum coccineum]